MDLSLAAPCTVAVQVSATDGVDAVYRQYFGPVWRLLRRLGVLPSQLDDAAQDVFLVVHNKLHELAPDARVRSWVFAIAVRVASDYRRRAVRRRTESLPETIMARGPGPAEQTELNESVRLLHELLSELGSKKRTVFVLAELEQLSVPEIAQVLGENLNTVYSRLRSARKRFELALARRRAQEAGGLDDES